MCCVALQLPMAIVAVSAGVRWSDYGPVDNCWLSTAHGTRWAFIAPVLAVIAVNVVVFVRVVYAVFAMKNRIQARRSSTKEIGRHESLVRGVRASLSFMVLLGITWVFGAIAIDQAAVANDEIR